MYRKSDLKIYLMEQRRSCLLMAADWVGSNMPEQNFLSKLLSSLYFSNWLLIPCFWNQGNIFLEWGEKKGHNTLEILLKIT